MSEERVKELGVMVKGEERVKGLDMGGGGVRGGEELECSRYPPNSVQA